MDGIISTYFIVFLEGQKTIQPEAVKHQTDGVSCNSIHLPVLPFTGRLKSYAPFPHTCRQTSKSSLSRRLAEMTKIHLRCQRYTDMNNVQFLTRAMVKHAE
jgi:hypothetical protein